MDKNVDFYNNNPRNFFDSTVAVDMSAMYARFFARVPPGGSILDAGCGSGRDAKAFSDRGFVVTAFDASAALARLASEYCGFHVQVRTFAELHEVEAYDGIWCCASLLHVPHADLPSTLSRLWTALRPGGCLYASFKLGSGEREHHGRIFTDTDEPDLRASLDALPACKEIEIWVTADQRPGRADQWVNALATRGSLRCASW